MANGNGLTEFEEKINRYYEKCSSEKEDYYELMGVPRNATQKQIEDAYTEKIETEFPRAKIEHMKNPKIKERVVFILQRIDYMFTMLTDFEKRGEYENKGYRETTPEDIKEEDPLEAARSNYKLGKSLYDQKAYAMALSALKEAVRLAPNKAAYYHQLALCQTKFANLGHEVEKNLQKALELEPWNANHHATLGMFYYKVKMNVRAEACFRKALSFDPENALAKKGLAQVAPNDDTSILKPVHNFLKKAMPTLFDR